MPVVERTTSYELTVQRSRFYAVLAPAADLAVAKKVVASRQRAVKRANHHCWACRLHKAEGGLLEQARDDGEVGRPGFVLLSVLQRHDLEGVLVVSRIFGGIKLGAGGVARAFRQAAEGVVGASCP